MAGYAITTVGLTAIVVAIVSIVTGYKFSYSGSLVIGSAYLIACFSLAIQAGPAPKLVKVVGWILGFCAILTGLGAFLG